jgi:wyosine [tRNA(Phe)-imidazoG37] synthetase (radical SAM superfamily)
LGITTVPYKVCSFDCVYCQLKRTTERTSQRKKYIEKQEILKEIRDFLENMPPDQQIDYITFSGSGEPTLNSSIGSLIKGIKKMTSIPLALITNSSTLVDPKVRREISGVDLIIPSLDAVTQDVFRKIDRPGLRLRIKDIIKALQNLRKEFKGRIWLEIMLVKGLNDSPGYLKKIKKVADQIRPDRIQINSPVRPPVESWVRPATKATLKKARAVFGKDCEIVLNNFSYFFMRS